MRTILALACMTFPAAAETPRVVADIGPVHGLVSAIMDGVGVPDLIVEPGVSIHDFSFRPSQAAALENADLVFWVGEALDVQFVQPFETLAANAIRIELMDLPDINVLPFREDVIFGDADHHEEDDDHEAHEEKEDGHHDEDGHDENAEHRDDDDHEAEAAESEHDHHAHGEIDGHAWLDPDNARIWLNAIADTLIETDPANASAYSSNLERATTALNGAIETASAALSEAKPGNHVVFHDAYQYFATHFDVPIIGAISVSEADRPSAARLAELEHTLEDANVVCVFKEPQFDPALANMVAGTIGANVAVLDPLGADLELGPTFYPDLLVSMATAIRDC